MEPDEEDFLVKMADSKGTGLCASGQRRFAEAHGIDFREWVKTGISARRLWDTGDKNARRVVMNAKDRLNGR